MPEKPISWSIPATQQSLGIYENIVSLVELASCVSRPHPLENGGSILCKRHMSGTPFISRGWIWSRLHVKTNEGRRMKKTLGIRKPVSAVSCIDLVRRGKAAQTDNLGNTGANLGKHSSKSSRF